MHRDPDPTEVYRGHTSLIHLLKLGHVQKTLRGICIQWLMEDALGEPRNIPEKVVAMSGYRRELDDGESVVNEDPERYILASGWATLPREADMPPNFRDLCSLFMAIGSLILLPLFLLVTYLPSEAEVGVWLPFYSFS